MNLPESISDMIVNLTPAQVQEQLRYAYEVIAQLEELKSLTMADILIMEKHLLAIQN